MPVAKLCSRPWASPSRGGFYTLALQTLCWIVLTTMNFHHHWIKPGTIIVAHSNTCTWIEALENLPTGSPAWNACCFQSVRNGGIVQRLHQLLVEVFFDHEFGQSLDECRVDACLVKTASHARVNFGICRNKSSACMSGCFFLVVLAVVVVVCLFVVVLVVVVVVVVAAAAAAAAAPSF